MYATVYCLVTNRSGVVKVCGLPLEKIKANSNIVEIVTTANDLAKQAYLRKKYGKGFKQLLLTNQPRECLPETVLTTNILQPNLSQTQSRLEKFKRKLHHTKFIEYLVIGMLMYHCFTFLTDLY